MLTLFLKKSNDESMLVTFNKNEYSTEADSHGPYTEKKRKNIKNTGMYYNIYILITVRQITEYFSVVLRYIE